MIIVILSRTERLHKKILLLQDRAHFKNKVLIATTLDDARALLEQYPQPQWLVDISTDTDDMMLIVKQLHEQYEQTQKPCPECIAGSHSVEPAMIQQIRLHHITMVVPLYKFEEIIKALIEQM